MKNLLVRLPPNTESGRSIPAGAFGRQKGPLLRAAVSQRTDYLSAASAAA